MDYCYHSQCKLTSKFGDFILSSAWVILAWAWCCPFPAPHSSSLDVTTFETHLSAIFSEKNNEIDNKDIAFTAGKHLQAIYFQMSSSISSELLRLIAWFLSLLRKDQVRKKKKKKQASKQARRKELVSEWAEISQKGCHFHTRYSPLHWGDESIWTCCLINVVQVIWTGFTLFFTEKLSATS